MPACFAATRAYAATHFELFQKSGGCSTGFLHTPLLHRSDGEFAVAGDACQLHCGLMYKLFTMQRSGNSYKVRLALALLNAPYRAIEIDILKGESRTPEFLAKNPNDRCRCWKWPTAAIWRNPTPSPLVRGDRHIAGAGEPARPRRRDAVDVLRTARARAEYRRSLFLALAGQGRARTACLFAGGLDGARVSARCR